VRHGDRSGAGAAVHNDLGVAYLESGNATQLRTAELEFQHALDLDRSFSAAVFNLAVFYERTNSVAQAPPRPGAQRLRKT